jgi:hypothetical protein
MEQVSKAYTQRPPASTLRAPDVVAAALIGLKAQAKAGKLNPEHAGYAAAVGESVRIALSPDLQESDRSAELIFIMGCFRSDPKIPLDMHKMIESYIDRVDRLCFLNKGKASELIGEWLADMHTNGMCTGYSSTDINTRLEQIRTQPLLAQRSNVGWLNASAIAAVNNALGAVIGAYSVMLLDSP